MLMDQTLEGKAVAPGGLVKGRGDGKVALCRKGLWVGVGGGLVVPLGGTLVGG